MCPRIAVGAAEARTHEEVLSEAEVGAGLGLAAELLGVTGAEEERDACGSGDRPLAEPVARQAAARVVAFGIALWPVGAVAVRAAATLDGREAGAGA